MDALRHLSILRRTLRMNKSNRKAAVPVIIKRELSDLSLLNRADVRTLTSAFSAHIDKELHVLKILLYTL